ncbi:helix-turn-helix transcriptional regulator [Chromobacterium haemolyticum]|nr:helix-turn-helix transcriptional regulator [Chromobacterium haemolyticum]
MLKEARDVTAQKLGISLVSLQNYEGGTRKPSAVLVAKFSRLTGARLDWLLFGEGEALPGATGPRTGEPLAPYAPQGAHVWRCRVTATARLCRWRWAGWNPGSSCRPASLRRWRWRAMRWTVC